MCYKKYLLKMKFIYRLCDRTVRVFVSIGDLAMLDFCKTRQMMVHGREAAMILAFCADNLKNQRNSSFYAGVTKNGYGDDNKKAGAVFLQTVFNIFSSKEQSPYTYPVPRRDAEKPRRPSS